MQADETTPAWLSPILCLCLLVAFGAVFVVFAIMLADRGFAAEYHTDSVFVLVTGLAGFCVGATLWFLIADIRALRRP